MKGGGSTFKYLPGVRMDGSFFLFIRVVSCSSLSLTHFLSVSLHGNYRFLDPFCEGSRFKECSLKAIFED